MTATEALLAVSALHAAFQLVVSVVVYPALADLAPAQWAAAHAAHSRRITVLVAPLYVLVAAGCAWSLLSWPVSVPVAVALVGHAVAAGTTALVAAPTHGRLAREGREGPDGPALVRRLLLSDRVRTGGAVVALAGAVVAVTT